MKKLDVPVAVLAASTFLLPFVLPPTGTWAIIQVVALFGGIAALVWCRARAG